MAHIKGLIQRRQQPRTGTKMVIHHRFGNPGQLSQAPQGQGFGTLLTDQVPGHVQELLLTVFPGQAPTRLRIA
ncbi:hypothetical protein D3C84_1246500 [compost metagenome]